MSSLDVSVFDIVDLGLKKVKPVKFSLELLDFFCDFKFALFT
jgi:hypothetical protein